MIPENYTEWKKCITVDCNIPLTKTFARQRLQVYENTEAEETQKFTALYGQQHLQRVIQWFTQVMLED